MAIIRAFTMAGILVTAVTTGTSGNTRTGITGAIMTMTATTGDGITTDTMAMTGIAVTETHSRRASGILDARRDHTPVQGRIDVLAITRSVLTRMHSLRDTANLNTPGNALDRSADNNRALESFFAEHEDKAFYVAYAALWDREAALDAVQESMLRLVQYYRHKTADDWPALFRTILNSRINDIRRKRLLEQGKHKLVSLTGLFRGNRDDENDNSEFELPAQERTDGVTAPEVEYIAQELRQHITQALHSLSERQRQVFILREWRGMSITETATTLGCSENSIKQHHFRAMRELRKQLAEVWDYAQSTAS
jgi:RNA polymerase sigma-70 factor (ECF subfamily)